MSKDIIETEALWLFFVIFFEEIYLIVFGIDINNTDTA